MQKVLFFFFLLTGSIAVSAQVRESVSLKTTTGNIYGTLTLPAKNFSGLVVIIIPDAGPTDREGNNVGLINNTLRMLSDSFAKYGIASLRYDKRGIGASKAVTDESHLLFGDYVKDATGWVMKLSKDKRFTNTFIIGHGEGSLVGMLAAQQAKVAGYISIAGPGKAADETVIDQISANPQVPKALIDSTRYLFDQLRQKGRADNVPGGVYQMLFRKSVQAYLASWIKYDPAKEISKVKVPVLILHGKKDAQVDTAQAELLAAAQPDARLTLIPDMNHIFRDISDSEPVDNLATMNDSTRPIDSILVNTIVRFIRVNSGRK